VNNDARRTEELAPAALEVVDVSAPFGHHPGLSEISFRVEPGGRFALVGASGAGKTTLLRAVSGSGSISAGQILVEGRDVTRLPPESRGPILLSQRPLLFPHLSVFENVAFPLRVRSEARDAIRGRVEEALSAVRLEGFGSRRPGSLSGGQAHRVALARAVVARPPVLLLDEPLTSLDPSLRDEVREAILGVQRDYGPALVLVTHDLEEAGRIADRVGVLQEGRLAQVGSPSAIYRQPETLQVARFLGLPNELRGALGSDGSLLLAGTAVPGEASSSNFEEGPVILVFGADAGHVVPSGAGGVQARVEAVHHQPQGAVATVVLGHGDAALGPGLSGPARCEVSVDPNCPPTPGSRVEVVFHRDRMHVFPLSEQE
jgi:putative spermidine/putrescine transport system ATP-binding protein